MRNTFKVQKICILQVLSHLVEPVEVLCGDDVVRVEVEDVEEEVPELVLLEVGEEVAARLHRAQLRHVVGETAVHPRRCKEREGDRNTLASAKSNVQGDPSAW